MLSCLTCARVIPFLSNIQLLLWVALLPNISCSLQLLDVLICTTISLNYRFPAFGRSKVISRCHCCTVIFPAGFKISYKNILGLCLSSTITWPPISINVSIPVWKELVLWFLTKVLPIGINESTWKLNSKSFATQTSKGQANWGLSLKYLNCFVM